MHEMSLIADLLRKIDGLVKANGAARVRGVTVKLGAFSHISADHFREHFEAGVRGSAAEGARLTVEESNDAADPHAQDILLESVDLDVPEDEVK